MARDRRKAKKEQRRKQLQRKKRRSLHDKHRRRRKKDLMPNVPFLVAYQGDPAMGAYFYCNDIHGFKLIAATHNPFERLHMYLMKGIASVFMLEGKILVKEAA